MKYGYYISRCLKRNIIKNQQATQYKKRVNAGHRQSKAVLFPPISEAHVSWSSPKSGIMVFKKAVVDDGSHVPSK